MGNEQPRIRLSPSGMEIGNPPANIGGNAIVGREWLAQGTDTTVANVPGTVAVNVLECDVDLKASTSGFKYDVSGDTNTYGTAGQYEMIIVGSTNGGTDGYPVQIQKNHALYQNSGAARLTFFGQLTVPGNLPVNKVAVQMRNSIPANPSLTYCPAETRLHIREISSVT